MPNVTERIKDQFDYKGTLGFLVYREGNVNTLVPNDISISQLGIEILMKDCPYSVNVKWLCV